MPITVHAKTSLDNQEVREQLERLYDTSPEFSDGQDAVEQLEQNLTQYTILYTAEFNTKIIGAVWATDKVKAEPLKTSWYTQPTEVVGSLNA